MKNDLWIFLRHLQTHPSHAFFRPLLFDALRDGIRDEKELIERMELRGFDLQGLAQSAPEPLAEVQREADRLDHIGYHRLTPSSLEYPASWMNCSDSPLTVTVGGSTAALQSASLSVVGSREASMESLQWMEKELPRFLQETGAVLVSGGARGIDQKAHSIAVRSGKPTVVFLPSGIENPYPADLQRWRAAVFETGGAFVSEYPARAEMRKQHFHHRNRLIAATGKMVLVVEARLRSGTAITATRAAEIGRPLLVVPGHAHDLRFAGSLEMLASGATLVRHHEDLTLFWRSENSDDGPPLGVEYTECTEG